jgi:hypothetical protein
MFQVIFTPLSGNMEFAKPQYNPLHDSLATLSATRLARKGTILQYQLYRAATIFASQDGIHVVHYKA